MTVKTTLIALSTVVALGIAGAASVAQASDHENQSGGYRIGPFGQIFGSPRGTAFGFAYAPRSHRYYVPPHYRMWRYEH
jgi:hypothetical protein